MMVPAATFVVVVMVVPAAALVFFLMVVTAATRMIVRMVMFPPGLPGRLFPGVDGHPILHSPGDLQQFPDQAVGLFRRQPQLLRSKGDGSFLHAGMVLKFFLDLGRAVSAVQIVDDVHFSGHGDNLLPF